MSYRIEVSRTARRGLDGLPPEVRQRVVLRIDALADGPRQHGVEALKGPYKGLHKLRIGEYRVILHIDDQQGTVAVLRVGHRRSVYR